MSSIDDDVGMTFDGAGICDWPRPASNEIKAAQSGHSADKPSPAASEASAERNADRIGRFPRLAGRDCFATTALQPSSGLITAGRRIASPMHRGRRTIFGETSALARPAGSTNR